MKRKAQVEQDFRNDLNALLDKYRAEIEASDHWTGYAECGSDIRMIVSIPALFDCEHNCTREAAEVDLGQYLVFDSYRDSSYRSAIQINE